jgi:hypothetical protein
LASSSRVASNEVNAALNVLREVREFIDRLEKQIGQARTQAHDDGSWDVTG